MLLLYNILFTNSTSLVIHLSLQCIANVVGDAICALSAQYAGDQYHPTGNAQPIGFIEHKDLNAVVVAARGAVSDMKDSFSGAVSGLVGGLSAEIMGEKPSLPIYRQHKSLIARGWEVLPLFWVWILDDCLLYQH